MPSITRPLAAALSLQGDSLVQNSLSVTNTKGIQQALPGTKFHPSSLSFSGRTIHKGVYAGDERPPSSVPYCTDSEADAIDSWEMSLDKPTSACDPYAVYYDGSFLYAYPCSASACLSEIQASLSTLPNCTRFDGVNQTEIQMIQAGLDDCKDDGRFNVTKATPVDGSPVPTNVCTASQIEQTEKAFEKIAKQASCEKYVVSVTQFIGVLSPCNSTCTTDIMAIVNTSLPDCYYEFDATNKKQHALDDYAYCLNGSATSTLSIFRSPTESAQDGTSGTPVPGTTTGDALTRVGASLSVVIGAVVAMAASLVL